MSTLLSLAWVAVVQATAAPTESAAVLALRDVYVLPMSGEPSHERATVLIESGLITAVAPVDEVEVPPGAELVEGGGRWLIPGLCDMHTHVRHTDDLLLNVLNGVTTIFDMGGHPAVLELRELLRDGSVVGPRLFAGLMVDGEGARWPARTPAEARERVEQVQREGWDFIKVYNSIPAVAFEVLMETAATRGIPVAGHAVREPGLENCLLSGMSLVAHAEEYLYGFFGSPPERERIPDAVDLTAGTGTSVVATLSTYHVIHRQWGERTAAFLAETLEQPEARYLRPDLVGFWRNSSTYADRAGSLEEPLRFQRELVRAFHAGGVRLLAGSDSPSSGIIGTFPGFLLHVDLQEFVACGLSPREALATATVNAGEFLRQAFESGGAAGSRELALGRIEVGAAADLVLLGKNPLEAIENTQAIEGVVLGGRWLSADWIEERLAELAERGAGGDSGAGGAEEGR